MSPFIYGNDGFNPSLRASNSEKREYSGGKVSRGNGVAPEWESDDENGSARTGSSPERYLSDYDEEDLRPADPEAEMRRRMNARVRQGSEGWEVRPTEWGAGLLDVESRMERPWEEEGRYRMYEPEPILDDDDDDDWGDTSAADLRRSNGGGQIASNSKTDTQHSNVL